MGKLKHTTITITEELEDELDKTLTAINTKRITGELNKSKIIRIALAEWITRQNKALAILDHEKDLHKTAEEILQEKGYA